MPIQIDERQLFGWKELLVDHNPCLDSDGGIDLNQDGNIEDAEIIEDTNLNGAIDENEAKAFCIKNRDALAQNINFFRFGQDFSADNPIHSLILYESQVFGFTDDQVEMVYSKLADILRSVQESYQFESEWIEMYPIWGDEGKPSPIDTMNIFRQALFENGADFGDMSNANHIFMSSVLMGVYECLNSSYGFRAIGHEMGWPLYISIMPRHMITKYSDEEGIEVNLDVNNGDSKSDEFYMNPHMYNIDPKSIELGIYLSKATPSQLESIFLSEIAQTRFYSGRIEEVEKIAKRSLDIYPMNISALRAFGIANLEQSDLNEAKEAFEKANEYDPINPTTHQVLAHIHIKEGNYEAATHELSAAVKLFPRTYRDMADKHLSQPYLMELLAQWETIIKNYKKTPCHNPSILAKAYEGYGLTFYKLEDYNNAAIEFANSIEANPTAFAWTYMGYSKFYSGKHFQAAMDFLKIIELYPDYAKAYEGMGMALVILGFNEKAMEALNNAIEIEPTATAYIYLGILYKRLADMAEDEEERQTNLDEAMGYYKKAIEIDPYSEEAHAFRKGMKHLFDN